MKQLLFLLIIPATLLAQQSSMSKTAIENKERLDVIIRDYYDVYDQLFPVLSESKLYTDHIENYISQPHRNAQKKLYESTLRRLKTIDKKKLPESSLYEYETLAFVLKSKLNYLRYEWYLLPESSFGPNRVLGDFIKEGGGNRYVTFATIKDYDNFLKRIDIFTSTICDTIIHYMRLGMKKNIVQPKRMMELVVENLEPVIQPGIEKNPFYEPILKMPDSFPLADKQRLKGLYQKAIQKKLQPAYAKAIDFIKTEYIPACRETVGICAYPWGKAAYQEKLNEYYGAPLPPDTLLAKAKRIDDQYRQELNLLMKKRSFNDSIDAFYQSLPVDSFMIFKTKQEVIDRFCALLRQVNDSIPKYFSLTPKSKLEVLEEPGSGNRSGGARFTSGSEDGARPDRIYLSIGDPAKANYTILPIGVLHEGDPGHHFSATNIKNINKNSSSLISKHEYFETFDEGWAFYAETWGKALGVYEDDYCYATFLKKWTTGAFYDELENGVNVDGWTFQQAIDSCVHQGWSKSGAEGMIFRIVSMPVQIHAYPIGYMKIVELRDYAKIKLKDYFDIREFHAQVLKDGPMPLAVLDKKIRRWVESQQLKFMSTPVRAKK
jgi:uncharacterized protein (DUF885 family)